MKKVIKYLPGMAIALVLAAAAKGLETLESAAGLHFIGASVIALFLGMIINHFRKPTAATAPGICCAKAPPPGRSRRFCWPPARRRKKRFPKRFTMKSVPRRLS